MYLSPLVRRTGLTLALLLAGPASAQTADDDLLLMPATSTAANDAQARGVLRARQQATLSSELAGRVLELPFAEGQSFDKGAVLARFDCAAYEAQMRAADAAARAAQQQLAQTERLAALNSVGEFDVAIAQSRRAEAAAQAQVYRVQVSRCTLNAPFAGQVVSREVQPFESVASGAPLLSIVDNSALEIHLLVPSRWISKLQPGTPFSFIPDETGQPLQASVSRLGARIDEGSQTLLLIAELPADSAGLLAGMSGTARFAEQP
ncbi:efflux RND transporter periplasmic adaptor subunit [Pseudomonas abyssi]|jgi:RND family efflux transporter MFP subunit|uniref:efflux RND transporter periplasmic adaptor subunit n=1 Tax=Pseudomonas abyssi TaxID=170540 RepID=UPI003C7E8D9F